MDSHRNVSVTLQSKHPHHTAWLKITHDETNPPKALLSNLELIGWRPSGIQPLIPLPSLNAAAGGQPTRLVTVYLSKEGAGSQASWMPDEKKHFLSEVQAILRRHGFSNLGVQKLTTADMM